MWGGREYGSLVSASKEQMHSRRLDPMHWETFIRYTSQICPITAQSAVIAFCICWSAPEGINLSSCAFTYLTTDPESEGSLNTLQMLSVLISGSCVLDKCFCTAIVVVVRAWQSTFVNLPRHRCRKKFPRNPPRGHVV